MALISLPTKAAGDTHFAEEFNEMVSAIQAIQSVQGWANYSDSLLSNQIITSTDQVLSINGLGGFTNTEYLPYEIRGTGDLWDNVTNSIVPINVGDTYSVRLNFTVLSKTGSPADINFKFDIGGAATPTNVILQDVKDYKGTIGYVFNFDLFALDTFKLNNCKIFMSVNAGTMTLGARSIFIKRTGSGAL